MILLRVTYNDNEYCTDQQLLFWVQRNNNFHVKFIGKFILH